MVKLKFKNLIILLIPIIVIACNNGNNSSNISVTGNQISAIWTKKYPQLINIQQQFPNSNYKIDKSQYPLVGNITNTFGIRDDILKNIVESIPINNDIALFHAIKYAQYSQAMYLSTNTAAASGYMQDMMYSIYCLSKTYNTLPAHNLILQVTTIRNDNKLRQAQERYIEQLLAFRIFKLNNKQVGNDCHIGGKY